MLSGCASGRTGGGSGFRPGDGCARTGRRERSGGAKQRSGGAGAGDLTFLKKGKARGKAIWARDHSSSSSSNLLLSKKIEEWKGVAF